MRSTPSRSRSIAELRNSLNKRGWAELTKEPLCGLIDGVLIYRRQSGRAGRREGPRLGEGHSNGNFGIHRGFRTGPAASRPNIEK